MTVRFAVSKVKPDGFRPDFQSTSLAIACYLRLELEACGAGAERLLRPRKLGDEWSGLVEYHPFVAAANLAYACHWPLSLTPDGVWLLIAQGLAAHVNADPEALREAFVSHEGKEKITVRHDGLVPDDPSSPWPEVFTQFSAALREKLGAHRHDHLVADFSTTGPAERAASEIVLMETVKSYFDFEVMTLCGIPEIQLEGSVEDWRSVRTRCENLLEFGANPAGESPLGVWIRALLPVLDEFVRAAEGKVNKEFWQAFYKLQDDSGGPYISGWIRSLFPYLDDRLSPWFDKDWKSQAKEGDFGEGPTTSSFSSGVSRVPFEWSVMAETHPMEFLAGFLGVSQDPETLTVRGELGWAVRHAKGAKLAPGPDTYAEGPPIDEDDEDDLL